MHCSRSNIDVLVDQCFHISRPHSYSWPFFALCLSTYVPMPIGLCSLLLADTLHRHAVLLFISLILIFGMSLCCWLNKLTAFFYRIGLLIPSVDNMVPIWRVSIPHSQSPCRCYAVCQCMIPPSEE